MRYYAENGAVYASWEELPLPPCGEPAGPVRAFLFRKEKGACRDSFLVTDQRMLAGEESAAVLDPRRLPPCREPIPAALLRQLEEKRLRAVNFNAADWRSLAEETPKKQGLRVHILALGDVGSTILMGLRLLGGGTIGTLGICDINEAALARWEFEMNQVAWPWAYDALPEVAIVPREQLFQCDCALFAASRGIPPVGSAVKDVRMAQFEANRALAASFAEQAGRDGFRGLFAVISDPVDPLSKAALLASGLHPEQIQGFGLGVMNARAAYYAKKDPQFSSFLTEGRAFGPHGSGLVIANSVEHYDDERSRALTELALTANLKMRELGFKPYAAPALSSAALNVLLALQGKWHYSSVYLGGVYFGCKNRLTPWGTETEALPLPDALFGRLRETEQGLRAIL